MPGKLNVEFIEDKRKNKEMNFKKVLPYSFLSNRSQNYLKNSIE